MTSKQQLVPVAYDQFVADVHSVAAAIGADGWQPDHLVGIGRGGLAPALWLSHAIGIPMLSIDYSAQDADFSDMLIARLAERSAAGARLLLIDDINDSGRTIAALRAKLPGHGVRFAVLIDSIGSTARADYSARTIDSAIDKRGVVFPWEAAAPPATIVAEAAAVPERLNPLAGPPAPPPRGWRAPPLQARAGPAAR